MIVGEVAGHVGDKQNQQDDGQNDGGGCPESSGTVQHGQRTQFQRDPHDDEQQFRGDRPLQQ